MMSPARSTKPLLWVVSGARRGVGKTWLSQRLAHLLPGGVYAKIGHNPPDAAKPERYFTSVGDFLFFENHLPATCRHCVVETSAMPLRDRADVHIFVGAPVGMGDVREDAPVLAAEADIALLPNVDAKEWQRVLATKVDSLDRITAICALFERQLQFLADGGRRAEDITRETMGEEA